MSNGQNRAGRDRGLGTVELVLYVNQNRHLASVSAIRPDVVAIGDAVCPTRCLSILEATSADTLAELSRIVRRISLVTPKLLLGRQDLERVACEVRRLVKAGADAVVVNNLGLFHYMRENPGAQDDGILTTYAWHAGRGLNLYNSYDIAALVAKGFRRVCVSLELTLDQIEALVVPEGIEIEVFGYGQASIAHSRMCYEMSLKGLSDYSSCDCLCQKEATTLGTQTGDYEVFEMYGRELRSVKRWCMIGAIRSLMTKIHALSFDFGCLFCEEECRAAIRAFRDELAGNGELSSSESRLVSIAQDWGLANGMIWGKPGILFMNPDCDAPAALGEIEKVEEITTVARNPEVMVKDFGDETISLSPATGKFYSLNETAITIWSKLDGRMTPDELVDCLLREYEGVGREECKEEVLELLEEFLAMGLVVT